MTTLSGGVSSNVMNTGSAWAAPTYPTYDYSSLYNSPTFDIGLSYTAPLTKSVGTTYLSPGYDMPVQQYYQPLPTVPVSTNTTTNNTPVNVNYSQLSSNSLNTSPIIYPDLQGLSPTQAPNMVQVGNRSYPASAVVAQAIPSFAPGGQPQMDTVSDYTGSYRDARQTDSTPLGQTYDAGSTAETLPDNLYGAPNSYMTKPIAPDYTNATEYQAAMNMPMQAIQSFPTLGDFYQPNPGPQLMVPKDPRSLDPNYVGPTVQGNRFSPLNALKRMAYASSSQARIEAARYHDAREQQKEAANRMATIYQTTLPGQIGFQREIAQQKSANYRTELQNFNQGNLALLGFHLDEEGKKRIDSSKALDLASRAFLLPPTINGRPNEEKRRLLTQAGEVFGWDRGVVASLSGQQDPNAAQDFKKKSLDLSQAEFDLNKAKQRLLGELNLLKAQVAQANAQAGLMGSEANTNRFNLSQRQQVAKYERWGMIAKSIDDVTNMLTNRAIKGDKVEGARLDNQKKQADIWRQQMETQAVPVELAARMSSAMAAMSQSLDPNVQQAGLNMADSVFNLLNIREKRVIIKDAAGNDVVQTVPVPGSNPFSQPMQQPMPQPGYRQRMPAPQPLPANYFNGAPLAGAVPQTSMGTDAQNFLGTGNGGQSQSVGSFPQYGAMMGGPASSQMAMPQNQVIQNQIMDDLSRGMRPAPGSELDIYTKGMTQSLGMIMSGSREAREAETGVSRIYDRSQIHHGNMVDELMKIDRAMVENTGKGLAELYAMYGTHTLRDHRGGMMNNITQMMEARAPRLLIPDLMKFNPGVLSASTTNLTLNADQMANAGKPYMQHMPPTDENIARLNQWSQMRSDNRYYGYREMAERRNDYKAVEMYDKWVGKLQPLSAKALSLPAVSRPADQRVTGRVVPRK